ncbi:MAG: hypothetical protein H8E47_08975 [Anaerolineales bacterium]|nr:hypothetical protein [Anaerolineales bacterium]
MPAGDTQATFVNGVGNTGVYLAGQQLLCELPGPATITWPPPPEPEPVGGYVVPVNKLGLVAPWMGLVTLAGLAGLGVVVVRRRRG